ncbi:MAG: hypothetical protein MJZ64_07200 [Paludibacteraceae bacterium]|nr:hypothetical protein [Paludibacteraceae bacterium]
MARMKFAYPIEELHGKIKGNFGAAQRQSKNNAGEGRAYSVNYGKRDLTNHPITSDEQARWNRFAAVQALVAARKLNNVKRVQDQQAFANQTEYKTLNAYLWHVCGQEYDASLED